MNELYKFTLNMNGINDYDYNSTGQCVSDSRERDGMCILFLNAEVKFQGRK